jgi:predicted NACHT family NTPase
MHWWSRYTVTDVLASTDHNRSLEQGIFRLELTAKEIVSRSDGRIHQRVAVTQALAQFSAEHVLLIGKPGSGKSTALARLLLEEATKTLANSERTIPVLVELRYFRGSIISLIIDFFRRFDVFLSSENVEALLERRSLLVICDGINELPSGEALAPLAAFRNTFRATPMVFTTRDIGFTSGLGIGKILELQSLTEHQIADFVERYLPGKSTFFLHQLGSRLRNLSGTPLLLALLCSVYSLNDEEGLLSMSLGMTFRNFTREFELQLKGDVPIPAETRRWWPTLLSVLAHTMTMGRMPTETLLALDYDEAKYTIRNFLEGKVSHPDEFGTNVLDHLIKYHLVQIGQAGKFEFRHQLIQEYYAAEWLYSLIRRMDRRQFQHDYLNYLKWTEPIALMVGLIDDRALAIDLVKLALDVDARLGARIAGSVQPDFRKEAVSVVAAAIRIPTGARPWNSLFPGPLYDRKIEVLGLTGVDEAIPFLIEILFEAEN